ncbi:hypothetical protein PMAYCL1PPCAC_03560, partial [Pristionchus mayeri]
IGFRVIAFALVLGGLRTIVATNHNCKFSVENTRCRGCSRFLHCSQWRPHFRGRIKHFHRCKTTP